MSYNPLPFGRIIYTGSKGQAFALSAVSRRPQRFVPTERGHYIIPAPFVNPRVSLSTA